MILGSLRMVVPNSFLTDKQAQRAARDGIAAAHRYGEQGSVLKTVNASNVHFSVRSIVQRRLLEYNWQEDEDESLEQNPQAAESHGFTSKERGLSVTIDFAEKAIAQYRITIKGGNLEKQNAIIKAAKEVDLSMLNKEVRKAVAAAKGGDYTLSVSSKAHTYVQQYSEPTTTTTTLPPWVMSNEHWTTTTTTNGKHHMHWGIRFFNRTAGMASGAERSSTFVGILSVFVFSASRSIHMSW